MIKLEYLESGSGKSTLLDIIMGFIKPNNGIIKIDNKFDLGDENNLFLWKKNWISPPK